MENEGSGHILTLPNCSLWRCSPHCGHILRPLPIREALPVGAHAVGGCHPPPGPHQLLLHCDRLSTVPIPAMASSIPFCHHAAPPG